MLTFKSFLTEKANPAREVRDKANVQKRGRYEIVRARIRSGVVQRRRKVSDTKGYEFKNGKLKRMSSLEKRHRKLGARHAKFKRKAHLRHSLMRRKLSLRKRHSLGL